MALVKNNLCPALPTVYFYFFIKLSSWIEYHREYIELSKL